MGRPEPSRQVKRGTRNEIGSDQTHVLAAIQNSGTSGASAGCRCGRSKSLPNARNACRRRHGTCATGPSSSPVPRAGRAPHPPRPVAVRRRSCRRRSSRMWPVRRCCVIKPGQLGLRIAGDLGEVFPDQPLPAPRQAEVVAKPDQRALNEPVRSLSVVGGDVRRLVPGQEGANVVERANPFGVRCHDHAPMICSHPRSCLSVSLRPGPEGKPGPSAPRGAPKGAVVGPFQAWP